VIDVNKKKFISCQALTNIQNSVISRRSLRVAASLWI